jgi:carboxylesterase type B
MRSYTRLLTALAALTSTTFAWAPPATTKNGTYEGVHLPMFEQDHYMGIQYAQAPTGALRYRTPQAIKETWQGIKAATKLPNACPQYAVDPEITGLGVSLDENCLALNIYKPAGYQAGLPVLVWIHGGSYQVVRYITEIKAKSW